MLCVYRAVIPAEYIRPVTTSLNTLTVKRTAGESFSHTTDSLIMLVVAAASPLLFGPVCMHVDGGLYVQGLLHAVLIAASGLRDFSERVVSLGDHFG